MKFQLLKKEYYVLYSNLHQYIFSRVMHFKLMEFKIPLGHSWTFEKQLNEAENCQQKFYLQFIADNMISK